MCIRDRPLEREPLEFGRDDGVTLALAHVLGDAGGALTGIPISSGANHFELTFFPPGLALGPAVSLISFVVLIVICIVTRRKKMRQLL